MKPRQSRTWPRAGAIGRSVLSILCAAFVVMGISIVPSTSGASSALPATAPPGGGFTSWDVGLGGPDQMDEPAGLPVRIEVSWWGVQDTPDSEYDWSRYDGPIGRAADAGMKVLLLVTYAPPWANGNHGPEDGLDHWFPTPDWDDEWAEFVTRLVQRYRDRAQAYEIWNEPNHAAFGNYGTGTDEERKRRYWDLVRLTNDRIKTECPSCVVVAGGSAAGSRPANQPQVPDSEPNPNAPAVWLDWAYRNGYGDDFDAVAHHPYPRWRWREGPSASDCTRPDRMLFGPRYLPGRSHSQQCGTLAALRAVVVDNGHAHKKIWGTEWGYPTYSDMGDAHAPLELIRDFDVEGVHLWRELEYVGPLFLYAFQDSTGPAGDPCTATDPDPECHYGIVTRDGVPKEPRYSDLIAKVRDIVPSHLSAGHSLRKWSAMRSQNGRFWLWMQGDGNLVLYDTRDNRVLWSVTDRNGRRLHNQTDGNLVLYRDPVEPVAIWQSGTWSAGPSTLWLQDDGNLVLYSNATDEPIWASHTVVAAP